MKCLLKSGIVRRRVLHKNLQCFSFLSVFSPHSGTDPVKKKKKIIFCGHSAYLSASEGGTWHFVYDASKLSELVLMSSTTAVTIPVRGHTGACHKYLSFTVFSICHVNSKRNR